MVDVHLQESVPLPQKQAFDVFVDQMDVWWPRRGVFPYSFAPETTRPLHIRFDGRDGGRYYETFADGSEYVIGLISVWNPPVELAYSWRDPNWEGSTGIRLRFAPVDQGTRVTYTQDGFKSAGVPWLIPYYQIGCQQTLSAYIAHCRALSALQELERSQEQS